MAEKKCAVSAIPPKECPSQYPELGESQNGKKLLACAGQAWRRGNKWAAQYCVMLLDSFLGPRLELYADCLRVSESAL